MPQRTNGRAWDQNADESQEIDGAGSLSQHHRDPVQILAQIDALTPKLAEAKALEYVTEQRLKIAKAQAMPNKGTTQEREASAICSRLYHDAMEAHADAMQDRTLLEYQLKALNLHFEYWRTSSANKRASI